MKRDYVLTSYVLRLHVLRYRGAEKLPVQPGDVGA